MEVNHACDLALVMEEEYTPPEEGATSEVKAPTVAAEESVETSMATAEDVTHPRTGSTSVLESLAGGELIHNPEVITSNVMEEGADSRGAIELVGSSQDEMSNKEGYSKILRVNRNKKWPKKDIKEVEESEDEK